ncbi:aspartate/glutamate racemase family protein [uncultured Ferrovibrio sp.]|uniref:aspartate/glutamate racemase family protein n=1 Tax=uncultured Ferrovibrio sp. TaxID=1576913 RepID=UPI00263416B4|nr:aspartate/glutamate racemase family protein [uncultured Ferrovibrio sp.]
MKPHADSRHKHCMRLLIINANTSVAMTERAVAAARRIMRPGTRIKGVTGRFGAEVIASRSAYAIASHAALDAYAEHGGEADAIVLACFGDPGLQALREVASVPVFGMAESGCRRAAELVQRFSIVTGGERWGPMLREYVEMIGLDKHLASVRTLASNGGQIAADPAAAEANIIAACEAAVAEDGAELVVLGGAGMIGMLERIADRVPFPVIDGFTPALQYSEAAAGQRITAPRLAPVPTQGLAPALAELLEGRD